MVTNRSVGEFRLACKRSVDFASTVGILLCCLLCGCAGQGWRPDPWRTQDTVREVVAEALLLADHGQTLTIADNPQRWHENSPILGEHPSRSEVNRYFIASEILHPVIAYALPTNKCIAKWLPCDWRATWQYVTIGVEAGMVAHNYSLGIHVGF